MSRIYDNWERLVTATLRKEHLRLIAQRTPSDLSLASLSSFSSLSFSSSSQRVSSFNFSSLLVGKSFSYNEILRATCDLIKSNIIHRGRSGDLYFGVLERIPVVVKKIYLSSVQKESYFISELEFHRKVSHSRMVPLIGHCLENGNHKFLVYEYMPNRSLSTTFFKEIVSDNGKRLPWLDWITRLKIAIGAAESLSYLHHECVPPLVHRDIQASSILLDDEFEVRLGSLSEVCAEEKHISQTWTAKFPRGSKQGASSTSNATCSYDVYCFGKVLLELITGKLVPSAANDLKDWMETSLDFITPGNEELVLKILDPSLILDKHLLTQVWLVAFVAKACLSPMPSKRPQMAHILVALEHIKTPGFTAYGNLQPTGHFGSFDPHLAIAKVLEGSEIIGRTSHETTHATSSGSSTASRDNGIVEAREIEEAYPNRDIFDPNFAIFPFSELMDASRNSRTVVGVCECPSVNQAWFHEGSMSMFTGSVVAVTKLYSQNMELLETWKSKAQFLGRLSHRNLVKFLGYCSMGEEELCLVQEITRKGSLGNHLFRSGYAISPLSWDVRLKILIGAARGLAFLHASMRHGSYEYFDPSDILLDGSYNAKVSGFGIAKIDRPNAFDDIHPNFYYMHRNVYTAPEYFVHHGIITGLMRKESDVYGFGVVMIETLTGLSAKDEYHERRFGARNLVDIFRSRLTNKRKFTEIMDPLLEGKYPLTAALHIGMLALTCLDSEPKGRPPIKTVAETLERIEYAKEQPKRRRINPMHQTGY